ncbi:MAG: glycosyltransferase family 2 protein [Phormidesmis sp.]
MTIIERRRFPGRCNVALPSSRRDAPPPTVTIGLPVYNGENFLTEAIESVLAQTFENYELVICDNASTDQTERICRQYARRDSRIRYYRNTYNKGPAWNYSRTFNLAQGQYFKWAAHDDIFEPTLLEKLVRSLEQHPEAVLSFCQVEIIDADGELLEPYAVEMQLDDARPARRFQEMISLKHRCYEVFGLIRTEALAQTALIDSYAGSDRVLLSRLSLQGRFEIVPEPLFKAREHAQQSIAMLRKPRYKLLRMHDYAVWFDPNNQGKVLFPNWRILTEYLTIIATVPIGAGNRMECFGVLCRWLFAYRNIAKLGRDVAIAAAQIIGRLRPAEIHTAESSRFPVSAQK